MSEYCDKHMCEERERESMSGCEDIEAVVVATLSVAAMKWMMGGVCCIVGET